MNAWARFVTRYPKSVILATLALTAFFALHLPDLRFQNRMLDWLPQQDPTTRAFIDIGKTFQITRMIRIAIRHASGYPTPDLIHAIDRITRELQQNPNIAHVTSITNVAHIKKLPDGIEVEDFFNTIPNDPATLKQRLNEAVNDRMLVERVISRDRKWLAINIDVDPEKDANIVFRHIVQPTVEKYLPPHTIVKYAGEPVNNAFADAYTRKDLIHLTPFTIALIVLILAWSFRTFSGTLYPLLNVLIATIWTFGLMAILRIPMTLITPVVPVLLIALGSAYGIHVYNRFVLIPDDRTPSKEQTRQALVEIAVPVLLAGLTTLIGFISFLTARLQLIVDFGLISAIGIGFATFLALTFLPALDVVFGQRFRTKQKNRRPTPPRSSFLEIGLLKTADVVIRHYRWIPAAAFTLTLAGLLGILLIQRKVNFSEYFPVDSPPRTGVKVVNREFGGANPLMVQFELPSARTPEALRIYRYVTEFLSTIPHTGRPIAISDFILELNDKLNNRYAIPETPTGVANLWFFVEGRSEIERLLTRDERKTVVLTTAEETDTPENRVIHHQISTFVWQNFARPWVALHLMDLNSRQQQAARLAEARRIAREIAWVIRVETGTNADPDRIRHRLEYVLIKGKPPLHDPDVVDLWQQQVRAYISGPSFDFFIDPPVQKSLIDKLLAVPPHTPNPRQQWLKILAGTVPGDEYDPDIGRDVVHTLAYLRRVTQQDVWVRRLWAALQLPSDNSELRRKVLGLLYDLTDDLAVYPESDHPGGPANPIPVKDVIATGLPSVLTRLDHFLFLSQIESLALALGLTFILMVIMRRSIILGLVGITPIIFTIAIIYGFLGFAGIPLDYATMMIASVSIGVGIDYTIHLLHGVFHELDRGTPLNRAVHTVMLERGRAIVANSMAITAGFLILTRSSMALLKNFGATMAGSMILAGFAAIVMIPALLLNLEKEVHHAQKNRCSHRHATHGNAAHGVERR